MSPGFCSGAPGPPEQWASRSWCVRIFPSGQRNATKLHVFGTFLRRPLALILRQHHGEKSPFGVSVGLTGAPALQTIYNAITNGTPCVVMEGSGRVADVIAQVAGLPVSEITVSRIQQTLSLFSQEMFETLSESRIVEWTKKVSRRAHGSGSVRPAPRHR